MSIPLARCLHHLSFFLWNRCSPYIPSFPNIPLPVPHSYAILNTDFIEEKYRSGHNGPDSKFFGLVSFSSAENPVFMRGHAVRKTEYFAVLSVSSFQKFFLCKKHQENGGLTYTEAYRSGHNGPDSKWSIKLFVLSTRKSSSHAGLSQFKKVNILLFCPVVLSSVFFRISGLTYGELSEWSKVQHSKCCVPKRNLGFESLTLRQKVQ